MLPDRVSNPGPPTYESGALPIALRGPAFYTGRTKYSGSWLHMDRTKIKRSGVHTGRTN